MLKRKKFISSLPQACQDLKKKWPFLKDEIQTFFTGDSNAVLRYKTEVNEKIFNYIIEYSKIKPEDSVGKKVWIYTPRYDLRDYSQPSGTFGIYYYKEEVKSVLLKEAGLKGNRSLVTSSFGNIDSSFYSSSRGAIGGLVKKFSPESKTVILENAGKIFSHVLAERKTDKGPYKEFLLDQESFALIANDLLEKRAIDSLMLYCYYSDFIKKNVEEIEKKNIEENKKALGEVISFLEDIKKQTLEYDKKSAEEFINKKVKITIAEFIWDERPVCPEFIFSTASFSPSNCFWKMENLSFPIISFVAQITSVTKEPFSISGEGREYQYSQDKMLSLAVKKWLFTIKWPFTIRKTPLGEIRCHTIQIPPYWNTYTARRVSFGKLPSEISKESYLVCPYYAANNTYGGMGIVTRIEILE